MNNKLLLIRCGLAAALGVCALGAGAQTAGVPHVAAVAPAENAAATASTLDGADVKHAGFLKSVQGSVQLVGPAGTRAAQSGDAVSNEDRIQTGERSGASLVLRDGTTMVVGPNSGLELKQFQFDSTTQDGGLFVSLLRGSMRMVTGLLGKTRPDAIRVDTQTATIGIRGTDFIVNADGTP